jgi:hypothetical protein
MNLQSNVLHSFRTAASLAAGAALTLAAVAQREPPLPALTFGLLCCFFMTGGVFCTSMCPGILSALG